MNARGWDRSHRIRPTRDFFNSGWIETIKSESMLLPFRTRMDDHVEEGAEVLAVAGDVEADDLDSPQRLGGENFQRRSND